MDKESLHNYGTTIIVTIILAILLVLAPSFGRFIETRIQKNAKMTKTRSENLIEEAVTAFDYLTEASTLPGEITTEPVSEPETEPTTEVTEDNTEVVA